MDDANLAQNKIIDIKKALHRLAQGFLKQKKIIYKRQRQRMLCH